MKHSTAFWLTLVLGTVALALCAAVASFTNIHYSLRSYGWLIAAVFAVLGFLASRPGSRALTTAVAAAIGSSVVPAGLALAHLYAYGAIVAVLGTIIPFVAAFAGAVTRQRASGGGLGSAITTGVIGVIVVAGGIHLLAPRLMQWASPPDTLAITPAPFQFERADGSIVTSDALHGKVVVLSFWASWCPPCGQELRRLQDFAKSNAGDAALHFITVNEEGASNLEAARAASLPTLSHYHITLETLYALDQQADAVKSGRGVPTIVVLDSSGRVRWRTNGYDPSIDLAALLEGAIVQARR